MQFAPKHVVTMVCAVSAAVVLAPVGVMAATGSLVNLTDPVYSSRKARVTATGGLYTETRPRASTGAFNRQVKDMQGVTRQKLYETTGPNRIAITEVTFTVRHVAETDSATYNDLHLLAYTQGAGASATCGSTGWTVTYLRSVSLRRGDTVQLTFDGTPIIAPSPASGRKVCVMAYQSRWFTNTDAIVAVSGFVFT